MAGMEASIAAQQAMVRHEAALSMVKQQANADQAIANILQQAAETVPAAAQGRQVDIRA